MPGALKGRVNVRNRTVCRQRKQRSFPGTRPRSLRASVAEPTFVVSVAIVLVLEPAWTLVMDGTWNEPGLDKPCNLLVASSPLPAA
jgi:hypothetical protein